MFPSQAGLIRVPRVRFWTGRSRSAVGRLSKHTPPAGWRWEEFMIKQHSRSDDPTNAWSEDAGRRGPGAGSLFVAALLGVGVGLLAAPQPGTKTRKQLLNRLAALSEGMGESF